MVSAVLDNTVLVGIDGLSETDEHVRLASCVQNDALDLLQALDMSTRELSVTICGDELIRDLNITYRDKPCATDVLSFELDHDVMLGDVIISVDTADRQAQERAGISGESYELVDELRVLLLHGVLHLVGFDHETGPEDHQNMADFEKELMARLNWKGSGLIESTNR
jgi:rRNA maturation RNase YbeY